MSQRTRVPRAIHVLRHRDFALVQVGNGISQVGTWGQYVALGWGIHELTDSPFAVALSLVAQFLPSLLIAPFGGTIADRFDRRMVVIAGNVFAALPAVALGVIVATGMQTIPLLLGLAAIGGIGTAVMQPAMSAIVAHIVPAAELPQAIASVSVVQNLTRIAGPTLGALVISGWGLQWAFYLNALSFLAVVAAWAFVRPTASSYTEDEHFLAQTRAGLRFARRDAQIRLLLLTTFVTTFIVYHAALLPVIATDVVHSDASGYALLQSATGVGAILGAMFAGEFTTDPRRRLAILLSLAGIGCAYTAVSLSTSLGATAVALAAWGLSYFTLSAVVQGLLIATSPDAFRGRIMGLYSMVTAGGVPIAALIGGVLGSLLGPAAAVGVAAVIIFAFLAWLLVTRQQRVIHYDAVAPTLEPADLPDVAPAQ